jgi:hypothetical protein
VSQSLCPRCECLLCLRDARCLAVCSKARDGVHLHSAVKWHFMHWSYVSSSNCRVSCWGCAHPRPCQRGITLAAERHCKANTTAESLFPHHLRCRPASSSRGAHTSIIERDHRAAGLLGVSGVGHQLLLGRSRKEAYQRNHSVSPHTPLFHEPQHNTRTAGSRYVFIEAPPPHSKVVRAAGLVVSPCSPSPVPVSLLTPDERALKPISQRPNINQAIRVYEEAFLAKTGYRRRLGMGMQLCL